MNTAEDTPVEVTPVNPDVEQKDQEKPKRKRTAKPKKDGEEKPEESKQSGGVQYRRKDAPKDEDRPTPSGEEELGQTALGPKEKKKRERKPRKEKETKEGEEEEPKGEKPMYRLKGEGKEEEKHENGDGEATHKEKKKRQEKKEPEKNLVYKNPLDFKETRKFKSTWEEYRFGDWRKGSGKTFVTIDTEIPDLPMKAFEVPDEVAFRKEQVEIEEKVKLMFKGLDERKG
jgi:hypothetical protein